MMMTEIENKGVVEELSNGFMTVSANKNGGVWCCEL